MHQHFRDHIFEYIRDLDGGHSLSGKQQLFEIIFLQIKLSIHKEKEYLRYQHHQMILSITPTLLYLNQSENLPFFQPFVLQDGRYHLFRKHLHNRLFYRTGILRPLSGRLCVFMYYQ